MPAIALLAIAGTLACTPRANTRDLVSLLPPDMLDPSVPVLFIRDATVFPATGTERLAHTDVIVARGKIAAVQPTGAPPPRNAIVIEGAGRTLLPGLVDAHVHVEGSGSAPWGRYEVPVEHNLEAHLYAGVTTIYDLGGDGEKLERVQRALESGYLEGPRLFHTSAPITAPRGHPIPLLESINDWPMSVLVESFIPQAEGPEDAVALVDEQLASDGDYVKVARDELPHGTPVLDDETLLALVRAGHARGKKVFVHTGSAEDALAAAQAGADVLAHGVYRGPLTPAQARTLASAKVKVIWTLAAFRHVADIAGERRAPWPLDDETVPPELLLQLVGEGGARFKDRPRAGPIVAEAASSQDHWAANVRVLRDAGVEIIPGSDSGLAGLFPGGTLHEDMRRLVEEGGLSPAEVLRAATAGAARLFLEHPSFGTIEPGKDADLLLVDGDPFVDIRSTTRIAAVIRAGELVERHPPPRE